MTKPWWITSHFGFPLGLVSNHMIKSNATDNHSSARNFPSAVDKYIHTELKEGTLLGPFKEPPHENYTWSSLMTSPKGDGHRVIQICLLDLTL